MRRQWTAALDDLLEANAAKPTREQLTLVRLFEELRGRGYEGGDDAVRRYATRWAKERGQSTAAAYVPLFFAPGEAFQFDWSHEVVFAGRDDGDRQNRPCPALPQPHAVRACLSTRDAGDGVRRARSGISPSSRAPAGAASTII